MIRAMLWKEYREHRLVWLATASLTTLLIFGLKQLLDPRGLAQPEAFEFETLGVVAFGMAAAYGLICGAMMFAGEREARTLAFLDMLSAPRTPVWVIKFLTGAAFSMAHAILVAGILTYLRLRSDPLVLVGLALDSFAFGLLLSAVCRTVILGAVLAVLTVGFSWWLLTFIGVISGILFPESGGNRSFVATLVPEPGTLGLLGMGLMIAAGAVRRHLGRR